MKNNPTSVLVVAAALVRADGAWLLHRRPAGKQHGGLWEFPGGKVEEGETAREALVREIAEEVGVRLAVGDLEPAAFADGAADGQGRSIVLILYTSRVWAGEPAALEGGEVAWVAPADMARLPMPPLDQALRAQLFTISAQ